MFSAQKLMKKMEKGINQKQKTIINYFSIHF
jgi:hypothetical protein